MEISKSRTTGVVYTTKKCSECFEPLALSAVRCTACKRRVGPIDKFGMAAKPIAWWKYGLCFLSWLVFFLYMWWAFFR